MRSMTGYGKAQASTPLGHVTVELTSVNHRNLDVRLRIPELCRFLDIEMRNILKANLRRGHVEGTIKIIPDASQEFGKPTLNYPVARAYVREAERFCQAMSLPLPTDPAWVLSRPDVWETAEELEETRVREAVLPAFHEALMRLIQSREAEGASLKRFMEEKLSLIPPLLGQIETLQNSLPRLARETLERRLRELDLDPKVNPDRLAQEIAYMAQRADIAEEASRLSRHVRAFEAKLKEGAPSGRELDFLIQEMNRETNTMGSKSVSYELTSLTLKLKEIINQLREQVQNVA